MYIVNSHYIQSAFLYVFLLYPLPQRLSSDSGPSWTNCTTPTTRWVNATTIISSVKERNGETRGWQENPCYNFGLPAGTTCPLNLKGHCWVLGRTVWGCFCRECCRSFLPNRGHCNKMLLLGIISDLLLVKNGMSDSWLADADFEGSDKKRSCFPVSFTKSFFRQAYITRKTWENSRVWETVRVFLRLLISANFTSMTLTLIMKTLKHFEKSNRL